MNGGSIPPTGVGIAIVIVSVSMSETPIGLIAATVAVNCPPTVGVPLITPVLALIESPSGKAVVVNVVALVAVTP